MESRNIGNKIAEARKKTSISQAQLAEKLFISAQAVGKWERGESMPDIITLIRLAKILGVDLNYFSEDFQSVAGEISSVELQDKPAAELPSRKLKNKLSWDMSRGNWLGADFSGLKNLHEKFSSSNMQRCRFAGSDLAGLLLKNNNVDSCDFSGSDLSNSHIHGSNLLNNVFKDCSIKGAEISGSNISGCDFAGAGLSETEFLKSTVYGCDFTGADLSGVVFNYSGFSGVKAKSGEAVKNTLANAVWNRTSFKDSHIADIVFSGTLEDCYFENCAFTRVTFKQVTFVNTFFKNKSLKRIQFIDCQADRMTYEFLKNGKADLPGIRLVNS